MRRILIFSLLLSPALFTASAVASQPVVDAAAPTQDLSVSTGVTAPVVIHSTPVEISSSDSLYPTPGKIVLTLKVDEKGKPSDIQVVDPANATLDEEVVDAVSKFRFQPATLDKQAVPVDMNLTLEFKK